jgi:site-specific DNA-methyltransferase (adenine-specific)
MNRLYFGDNLQWLRDAREFPDASVDLVYLDPPFNSNADYNVLFRETSGEMSQAQFHDFTDTWSWADAAMKDLAYNRARLSSARGVATATGNHLLHGVSATVRLLG